MHIEKVLTCQGISGYFNKDLAAVKAGAIPDGFISLGQPKTPGFHAITQPGEALSVMLILNDGQVGFGDCIDVIFTGAAGRDPLFKADEHQKIVEREIADFLRGKPLSRFKPLAQAIDTLKSSDQKLHTALRYGVTQALLDATAKAHHVTMAEVIANEYGCMIADQPIPLLACTANDQKVNVDKMILKKAAYLPHGSSSNRARDFGEKGEKLMDYVHWVVQRIKKLGAVDYHPTIHLDLYGILGEAFAMDIAQIAQFIGTMQEACTPFPLIVETPIIADSRNGQIQLYRDLMQAIKEKAIGVKIIVDEWCNTLEDIRAFAEAGASDIIQIKTPDLGSIHNSIEAVLICKENGIGVFIGGTANGTDQSARVSAHIALATQADFLLVKPGQGVDEGLMILQNEMRRTLALIQNRLTCKGSVEEGATEKAPGARRANPEE
jgi:methylaspartate ammonia-lyase